MNIRGESGNFQFQEDLFSKTVQGIVKIYHEVLLLMRFLQTKLQVTSMNVNCYDLYDTVIKSKDDKEIVNNKSEDNGSDYINFIDFITPNQIIGIKPREIILRW